MSHGSRTSSLSEVRIGFVLGIENDSVHDLFIHVLCDNKFNPPPPFHSQ